LPGDIESIARSINDIGAAAGSSIAPPPSPPTRTGPTVIPRPVIFEREGGVAEIGGGVTGEAFAINNRGQAVGYTVPGTSLQAVHQAALFDRESGEAITLPVLPGGSASEAFGINDRKQAVGFSSSSEGPRATLWQDGTVVNLGLLPGDDSSGAWAINNRGHAAGSSSVFVSTNGLGTVLSHAVLFANGTVTRLPDRPGAIAGNTNSEAFGINDFDQVVGDAEGNVLDVHETHAVLWEHGSVVDLGTLPGGDFSSAAAINNLGLIAGRGTDASGQVRAVLWLYGTIINLGTLPGHIHSEAYGINDWGVVVGESEGEDGLPHAVIWEPGRRR
jgi:probable HAF family extracellular repeat protein